MKLRLLSMIYGSTRINTFIAAFPLFCFFFYCVLGALPAGAMTEIRIGLIQLPGERPPNLSNLEVRPENEGAAGAEISITDNNTTGKFLNQAFSLAAIKLDIDADILAAYRELREKGVQYIVVDAPKADLLKLVDAAKNEPVLFFNSSAPDDDLRVGKCYASVFHIVPSRSMMTDALAQFLVKKQWRKWFLISGTREGDKAYAAALRNAAAKFGARIVEERSWDFGADTRRVAQAEVPHLTQGVTYDVIVVADEIGVFGEYLMYRTWDPRPVAGTQGLSPTTWHKTHEQWGAAQLQSRFFKRFKRSMTALDYQVWAPIRAVGEGASRTNSGDFDKIRAYLKSDDFELAGFKGVPMSFRKWNNQLRQPILLAHPASLVSASPQDGFLHKRSTLDTMGYDNTPDVCDLTK